MAAYKHRQPEPRKCIGCGVEFIPKVSNQLFCSEQCRNRTPRLYKCPICGTEFLKKKRDPRGCSPECNEELRRREEQKEKKKHAATPRMKTIEEIVVEAARLHMSYGEYVASKYFKE